VTVRESDIFVFVRVLSGEGRSPLFVPCIDFSVFSDLGSILIDYRRSLIIYWCAHFPALDKRNENKYEGKASSFRLFFYPASLAASLPDCTAISKTPLRVSCFPSK